MNDLRIESSSGTSLDTKITYNGEPVKGVSALSLSIRAGEVWKAQMEIEIFELLVHVQEGGFAGTLDERTKATISTLPKKVIRDLANELLEMSNPSPAQKQ